MTNTQITAGLLPIGMQQFFDNNGNPLAAGQITFKVPNTNTLKDTWQDPYQNVLNANPVVLDSAGRATIYGAGQYTMEVRDSGGNLIFSALTSDSFLNQNGSQLAFLWCGTATGTGNAYSVSPNPAITGPSLTAGTPLAFVLNAGTNTDAATLTITNIAGSFALKKIGLFGLEDLKGGEIVAGEVCFGVFDGTQVVLLGVPRNSQFTNFCGTSSGTADAQILTSPGIAGVVTGQMFGFVVGSGLVNDGPATIQFNTSTAIDINKLTPIGPVALSGGELQPGSFALCIYDGTVAQLLNPGSPQIKPIGVNTTADKTTSGTLYRPTANVNLTLPKSSDVWNGYCVRAIADSHTLTFVPDAGDVIQNGSAGASVTLAIGSTATLVTDGAGNWWYSTVSGASGGGGASLSLKAWLIWSGTTATASQNVSLAHTGTGHYNMSLSGGFSFTHGSAMFVGVTAAGGVYVGSPAADLTGTDPTVAMDVASITSGALHDADGFGMLLVFGE